jgi:Bifunctional DNA primase/polymerase, N-terminal/AAA domain
MPVTTKTFLQAALAFAADGWPVFPCNPQDKSPLTLHGHLDATTNEQTIKAWWKQHPKAMIGVPMGRQTNTFCADLDIKENVNGRQTWAALVAANGGIDPITRLHETPSGGQHRLYEWEPGIRSIRLNKLAEGLEIKGDGGYIVVPPSVRDNGKAYISNELEIVAAPEWLLAMMYDYWRQRGGRNATSEDAANENFGTIDPELEKEINEDLGKGISFNPNDYYEEDASLEKVRFALGAYRPDYYYPWFETGSALFKAGFNYDLWVGWSRTTTRQNFDLDACRRKWQREFPKIAGFNINTVFGYADDTDRSWRDRYGKFREEQRQQRNHSRGSAEDRHGPGSAEDGGHHARQKLYTMVWAKDVVMRSRDALWEGHLVCGAQELTTGLPDLGKSQLHCCYAAIVTTTNKKWPDGTPGPTEASNVIMLTAEDTLDQDIVPRLVAAGADLDRVAFLKKIKKDKKERMFLLGEDLDALEQMIMDIGHVRLVSVDPITAFMGKINSNLPTDVRGQLGPLADLAERSNVAFSTITHPPKSGSQRALDHFISSQAFIAAARVGHICNAEYEIGEDGKPVRDERGHARLTGRNLLSVVRCAVGPKMPTLAYRIAVLTVGQDQKTGRSITAPYVIWEGVVNVSADQAVGNVHAAYERDKKSKNEQSAVSFLEDMLASGPVPKRIIEARAAGRFSLDQLDRAKKKLGVLAEKAKGANGGWLWRLPDPGMEL